MILECKSCQKKFLVPDNAITSSGRLVQCSSCGNKWTQFPLKKKNELYKKQSEPKELVTKIYFSHLFGFSLASSIKIMKQRYKYKA